MPLRYEPLSKAHDRTAFSSGNQILDRWFRTQAGQDSRRDVARVFVALDDEGIAGFYTLSMYSVGSDALPIDVTSSLPKYPEVPAALIGRLARADRLRGKGVGELLVIDAFKRVVASSAEVAAFAIVVDAKDLAAQRFYAALGFRAFPSRASKMFIPIAVAKQVTPRR
jgi:GNAT superfamily N-acetyltransferase